MKLCRCGKKLGCNNKSGLCRKCYHDAYYLAHREEFIKKASQWAKNNVERYRAYRRELAKKKWAALSPEEKTAKSREQEKKRSKKDQERKRSYFKKYYQRNKERWKKYQNYKSPCTVCGKADKESRYIDGKCRSCYRKEDYKKTHPWPNKFCVDCGKKLSKYAWFDKCRKCRGKERYQNDPGYRNKIRAQNARNNKKESAREKKRLAVIRRRARIAQTECTLTLAEWHEILNTFKHRCAYCGNGGKLEKDHVIPISKGGPTTKDNIVPACRSCNSKKHDEVEKFFPRIPENV